jgi:hypothetical protein
MTGLMPRTPIDQIASSLDGKLVPLGRGFSYMKVAPIAEEDLKEYLHEPIGSLPANVCDAITPVRIVLAPFLERVDPGRVPVVTLVAPEKDKRLRSAYLLDDAATLFFAVGEEHQSEYHEIFFNTLAHLLSRRVGKEAQGKYASLLLAEIEQRVSGEVDDPSWERKQELPRRAADDRPSTKSKAFREYVAQSFTDTMTLYMHGICCDIDVETGPRKMPSRWLRKRLEALYEMFPPPNGRPVLPEHLSRTRSA